MKKIERRFFDLSALEVRSIDGKVTLHGHAAVFDKPSLPILGFREIVRRGSFTETLKTDDIRALWNHDSSLVLGRNKSGTLRLVETEHGLEVEIDVPDTQMGRDAAELVRRGDVSQMSFGFRTITDRWYTEDGEDRRDLLAVSLFDVSPVTFPAYPDTDISARALIQAGIDVEKIGAALASRSAGVELRKSDLDAISSALVALRQIVEKNSESARVPQGILLRKLALLALDQGETS